MEKFKENQKISVLFMLFGTLFCVCLIIDRFPSELHYQRCGL